MHGSTRWNRAWNVGIAIVLAIGLLAAIAPTAAADVKVARSYDCDDGDGDGTYDCSGHFYESDEGDCYVEWTDDDPDHDYEDAFATVTSKTCSIVIKRP